MKLKSKTEYRVSVLNRIYEDFRENLTDDFRTKEIEVLKAECFKNLHKISFEQFKKEGNSKKKSQELCNKSVRRYSFHHHVCDIQYDLNGYTVSILIGRGQSTQTFFESLGRALTASLKFDFVCLLFIDLSPEMSIKGFVDEEDGEILREEVLWQPHNIKTFVL